MAQVGNRYRLPSSDAEVYEGINGTGDNAVVIETLDVSKHEAFSLACTQGSMDVFVSLDGTNFLANPISMEDFSGTTGLPVLVAAADGLYQFRAKVMKIQVQQNGATAVQGARLICWEP